jgi:hypothetical protein
MSSAATDAATPAPATTGVAIRPLEGLVLALIAGGVVWGLIEATHPVFHVRSEFHIGMNAPVDDIKANRREEDRVLRNHAMLYVGSLGLALGLLLGAREAILRRSWLPPFAAAPLGAFGGVLGGFLGCLVYEYVRAEIGQAELKHTIGAQWLLAAPLGLALGLGLSLATRKPSEIFKAMLGGLAAATLAAGLYPVLLSVVLPDASTENLLPEELGSRLVWLAILAGLIGLIIPLAGQKRAQENESIRSTDAPS